MEEHQRFYHGISKKTIPRLRKKHPAETPDKVNNRRKIKAAGIKIVVNKEISAQSKTYNEAGSPTEHRQAMC